VRTALVPIAVTLVAGGTACSRPPPVGAPVCSAMTRQEDTPRSWELWGTLGLSDDRWDDRSHGTVNVGAQALLGIGAERYHRFGIGVAGEYGHFGDNAHGPAIFEPSVNYRGAFVQDPIATFYVLAMAGLQVPRAALRPRAGLGIEVLKTFLAEMTGDALVAMDGTFQESRSQTVVPGLSVTLGYEWGGALVPTRVPGETDLTCTLYSHALRACRSIPVAAHAAFCEKVSASLDTEKHPILESEDSTMAFLRAMGEELQGTPALESTATDLASVHKELEAERAHMQQEARRAAQSGRSLVRRCAYAPYAVELRKALGCDDSNQFTCAAPAMCVDPVNCCAR
jgi:hypothetical protein